MNILLLGAILFTSSLLVIELSFYAYHNVKHPDRSEVQRRLRQSMVDESGNAEGIILKKSAYSEVPFIHRILALLPGIDRIQLLLNQANVQYALGFFILLSMVLGLVGYLFCSLITRNGLLSLAVAALAGSLPMIYVTSKKNKRMKEFEKQFPDALDLIARALRAGHAFTSGMKLAADEFSDPLGPYFEEALDEINFGVGVSDALKNLTRRVDCPDLKFFVVSVILQRETGGNLAEIIEGVAHLMRERFKFRGRVITLSAEGRLTGKILVAVPILLFLGMYLLNENYTGTLISDPIGKFMIGVATVLMFVAFFVINRIVSLDV